MIKLKYFEPEEFNCPCCGIGSELMNEDFIYALDLVRQSAGIPFIITSAYRCESHNKSVGGSPTSSHTMAFAVDIKCTNSSDRFKIIEACYTVGIYRIGIGKDFIHLDDDPDKPDAIWVY